MGFRIITCVIFLIAALPYGGRSQSHFHESEYVKNYEKGLVLEVVMGDWFRNDSADIYIGKKLLFKNVKLNTSQSDGLADVSISIRVNKAGRHRVQTYSYYQSNTIPIKAKTIRNPVKLTIVLNGSPFEYALDLSKGRYVVFYKSSISGLIMGQSHRMTVFD
jgi:hypothetical protein